LPVAIICPPFFVCAGVTSATIGSTMPDSSDMLDWEFIAARPFTTPTAPPSVVKVGYSLCAWM